jgi:glutathione S-transferase
MALCASETRVVVREIKLSQKPPEFTRVSAKATVPVLLFSDDSVIDESMEIMLWALRRSDPYGWLDRDLETQARQLIEENDEGFKAHLDHYKYFDRHPGRSRLDYRQQAEIFIHKLEQLLQRNPYLLGDRATLADVAIMPFVRQFAGVEPEWFESSRYACLKDWLKQFIQSQMFLSVMEKFPLWKDGESEVHFPR